jgi:hypothetical protein
MRTLTFTLGGWGYPWRVFEGTREMGDLPGTLSGTGRPFFQSGSLVEVEPGGKDPEEGVCDAEQVEIDLIIGETCQVGRTDAEVGAVHIESEDEVVEPAHELRASFRMDNSISMLRMSIHRMAVGTMMTRKRILAIV